MTEVVKVPPIPAVAKCSACGAPARLDHLMPHATEPIDHFVFRCTSCAAFSIIDRPRPPLRKPDPDDLQQAM